jgi:gas vesicle protein
VNAGRSLERERSILARGQGRATIPPTASDVETDWQHVAIFAAGAMLGAALGAGAALLLAPMSGEQVRHHLARRGRRLRSRTSDAWDDLRDELQFAARRGRRKIGRALRHRRANRQWQQESALDD